ncbi:ethanolamine ammonia-lyase small subunit [Salinisphaera dokdonensis CL-ES53]|uniref:Ethanolamine ammonia-lyase small subunit n=1 Tax=Salinisphaera dokdonensis CL-ES53 TaxID=1304272 RepID=A0ABV2B3J9_9GAMM
MAERTNGESEAADIATTRRAAGVVDNPWRALRDFTDARIGLGRAGISLPTHELLAFQLAHAQAKDAVHLPLDVGTLCEHLMALGAPAPTDEPLRLRSQANDRITYLQRPDLGRRLDDESCARLGGDESDTQAACDLALVVVDGLSARAVQAHAAPFIGALSDALDADDDEWQLARLTVVEQGRVAIGDEIGERLNARAVLVLIGERPGLSSPDSLGVYLTWSPEPGTTDAYRNCISNIRPAGLQIAEASERALYLLREARRLELSGVKLKDRSGDDVIEHDSEPGNFLIS